MAGRTVLPTFQVVFARRAKTGPLSPVTKACWPTKPAVVSLAHAAYHERRLPSGELDPPRQAVLADALEEVGAPDELTDHLRAPGPHVRGCWAVDLALRLG